MTLQLIFLSIAAVVMLIGVPVMLIWCTVDYFRGRGSERKGSGGISSGIGGAMLELDRLSRPSVEHHVDAEQQILKREDDSGGE